MQASVNTYDNLVNSINSDETKEQYEYCITQFLKGEKVGSAIELGGETEVRGGGGTLLRKVQDRDLLRGLAIAHSQQVATARPPGREQENRLGKAGDVVEVHTPDALSQGVKDLDGYRSILLKGPYDVDLE